MFFLCIVDLDLFLNESEPNITVTEETVNVESVPDLLSPGNILYFKTLNPFL